MLFDSLVLATAFLYASLGFSYYLIRGCEREVHILMHQSEEIRFGITGLRETVRS